MVGLRSLVGRFAVHLLVVLAGFALVAAFIVVQDQREVVAATAYAGARADALGEIVHAQAIGMTAAEVSDLVRQDRTIADATPPAGRAPFNQSRINFFNQGHDQEAAIVALLRDREAGLLNQTRSSATEGVVRFIADLRTASQIGVDDGTLKPYQPIATGLMRELNQASTIGDYRDLSAQLKTPANGLALILADQRTANTAAAQFAAQVAAIDHGDPSVARQSATNALSSVRNDLQLAAVFQVDVSVIQARVDRLALQLGTAQSVGDLEQVAGGLQARSQELEQVLSTSLPDKAIVISLKDQLLTAYEHGKPVYNTLVTTGRPGLETDTGSFKVYSKQSPFTMHSPWPKGSPYWYPDTPVRTVMWFDGGAGIHDSSWRAYYGPGTEFPHYDPYGDDNGSHGCVNVPPRNMPWLWNWTPTGTPVIVY